MKSKAGFIKNIILVVASALTLVAVTFAWFTTVDENMIQSFNEKIIAAGNLESVKFFEKTEGQYTSFAGDITLKDASPGDYNQYKILIKPQKNQKTKLSLKIRNLPAQFTNNLDDYINIKYVLMKDDATAPDENNAISKSEGYIPLSLLENGTIFNELNLSAYQESGAEYFTIFYEIGLSESASQSVSGLSSALGNLEVIAVEVS